MHLLSTQLFQILPEIFYQIKVLVLHAVSKIVPTFPVDPSSNHNQLLFNQLLLCHY